MYNMTKDIKQRLTAFIEPDLVKRVKVRGALEGLTISEIVEKALDAYAPKIEEASGKNVSLKFLNSPAIRTLMPKHTKRSVEPR